MAKTTNAKAAPAAPKPKGRPKAAAPKPTTPIVMTIRARPEWTAWVDEACEALGKSSGIAVRIDRTTLIDSALGLLAEKLGMPKPPARY